MIADVGLFLTIVFCLSPLPTLYYSITKNRDLIKSISLTGIIMLLTSAVVTASYCDILELDECLYGNIMNIVSGYLCLCTICYLSRNLNVFLGSILIYSLASFLIFNYLSLKVTDVLVFIANTLGCITFNLDILT
jgi:hypothetical protein